MKALLAISWEMPPMYGPRATQVSRVLSGLAALGWSPTVVCMDPRPGGPHFFAGSTAQNPGIKFVRVRSRQESFAVRAIWRVAPKLRDYPDPARVWIRPATRASLEAANAESPAALISFAQPWSDHLVGLRVHRATRLPWVAHFSDPWADSPYATPRQRSIWGRMEADVIRAASAVVFVTEQTADLVMKKYPEVWRRKVAIVPHGFVPHAAESPSPQSLNGTRPMKLVYTGRFYRGLRTPLALFEAIATLNRRSPLAGQIEVSLTGPDVGDYARDAVRLGLGRLLKFHGRVSAPMAGEAAAGADALLVIDAPTDSASVFLPSKLVDYLAFRKPILGLTPARGATADLLNRLHFPVVPPDDVPAIAAAVEGLLTRFREGTLSVDDSFDLVAAHYEIGNTSRMLSDVLARACA